MERGLTVAEVAYTAAVPVWVVLAWDRGKAVPANVRARLAAYLLAHSIPPERSGERKE